MVVEYNCEIHELKSMKIQKQGLWTHSHQWLTMTISFFNNLPCFNSNLVDVAAEASAEAPPCMKREQQSRPFHCRLVLRHVT